MKALLMYRDRDFDPQQVLARRDRELRYRNADRKALDIGQLLPWNEAALTADLGLETIFAAMANGDKFLLEVATVALLSSLRDDLRAELKLESVEGSLVVLRPSFAGTKDSPAKGQSLKANC